MIPRAPVPHLTVRAKHRRPFTAIGRAVEGAAVAAMAPVALGAMFAVALASRLHMPAAPVVASGNRQANPQNANAAPAQQAQPVALVPFTRASAEHVESQFYTKNWTAAEFTAGNKQGSANVPADGYLRSVLVEVQSQNGAAAGTNAVLSADGPWNIFSSLELVDTNGHQLFGAFDGFEAKTAQKWGGYTVGGRDPALYPLFSTADVGGNLRLFIRIPVELCIRDALGSIGNENAANPYRVRYTLNPAATIFSTPPGTVPDVTVTMHAETWGQPSPADLFGHPQSVAPPAHGTVQFWSRQEYDLVAGQNKKQLSRVGNFIRELILIWKTNANARAESQVPTQIRLSLDGQQRLLVDDSVLRTYMYERFGMDRDTGVRVLDFTHDFGGYSGQELRDLWVPTTPATKLQIEGVNAAIGKLVVLTNDVQVPAGQSPFFTVQG